MARVPRRPPLRQESEPPRRRYVPVLLIAFVAAVLAAGGAALLINIFERKQEARNPFYRVVELTDEMTDPALWGKNFPPQYDAYRRTVDQVRTRFGGSEAMPRTPTPADPRSIVAQSRLEEDPRLKTMWAGYAFARDFREDRGHAYMLDDQTFTERQRVLSNRVHACTAMPPSMWRISSAARAQDRQRRGQFFLDFVEAENSMGFHAPQEAARILAESIDFSRQGQIALRDRARQ